MVIGHEVYHSLNFRLKKNGFLVGSLRFQLAYMATLAG
jgi:hypothetical protein